MAEQGSGAIVTMGWDQAETGMEGDSGELFAATKGAIMSFTRSLALSLAPAVRVNALAPGWIKTAWGEGASSQWHDRVIRETPLGRWGTPEDVAAGRVLSGQPGGRVRHGPGRAGQRGVRALRGQPWMTQNGSIVPGICLSPADWPSSPCAAMLDELAPRAGFSAEVAVLPISVAALMTPRWVARHLEVPDGIDRVILPGHCRGDLAAIADKAAGMHDRGRPRRSPRPAAPLRPGPAGQRPIMASTTSRSWPKSTTPRSSSRQPCAEKPSALRSQGADVIDLGCDPGNDRGRRSATRWRRSGTSGLRVSIDSFDPVEVDAAVAAGAELVLSVNGTNRSFARDWGVEVVAIPDQPGSLEGLDQTIEFLVRAGVPFRIDPILEPIGFGFAASLERYFEVRRRYPEAAMMMGVGNLTELTDVDSAGVNTILAGLCQELRIQSVLTTAVINWARSSVRELDLARRLVYHAVTHHTLPKHVEPRLVALRNPKVVDFGAENLAELQRRIRDPNWRIFAEGGMIYALNNAAVICAIPIRLCSSSKWRSPTPRTRFTSGTS